MTWTEVAELDRDRVAVLLPLGAVEAHGPHLPLATDGLIAAAMAEAAAEPLADAGLEALLLPPLEYAPAPFAAAFAGTLSIRGETLERLLADLGAGLADHGFRTLGLANAHLDPAHLASLHRAVATLAADGRLRVAFPDLTRRPWGSRLGEEFRSGACHAGRFEGSLVMAAKPGLVREEARRELPANPASLSEAIRAGRRTFEEAGGPRAYFGDPAAATAEEGRQRILTLGRILAEAVLEVVAA